MIPIILSFEQFLSLKDLVKMHRVCKAWSKDVNFQFVLCFEDKCSKFYYNHGCFKDRILNEINESFYNIVSWKCHMEDGSFEGWITEKKNNDVKHTIAGDLFMLDFDIASYNDDDDGIYTSINNTGSNNTSENTSDSKGCIFTYNINIPCGEYSVCDLLKNMCLNAAISWDFSKPKKGNKRLDVMKEIYDVLKRMDSVFDGTNSSNESEKKERDDDVDIDDNYVLRYSISLGLLFGTIPIKNKVLKLLTENDKFTAFVASAPCKCENANSCLRKIHSMMKLFHLGNEDIHQPNGIQYFCAFCALSGDFEIYKQFLNQVCSNHDDKQQLSSSAIWGMLPLLYLFGKRYLLQNFTNWKCDNVEYYAHLNLIDEKQTEIHKNNLKFIGINTETMNIDVKPADKIYILRMSFFSSNFCIHLHDQSKQKMQNTMEDINHDELISDDINFGLMSNILGQKYVCQGYEYIDVRKSVSKLYNDLEYFTREWNLDHFADVTNRTDKERIHDQFKIITRCLFGFGAFYALGNDTNSSKIQRYRDDQETNQSGLRLANVHRYFDIEPPTSRLNY